MEGAYSLDDRRFSVVDIDRWVEHGLVSRKQAEAILRAEGLSADRAARADDDHGLTVITLFSYLGAFLALTGIFVFAAINWGDASTGARVALILPVTIVLIRGGYHLRSQTSYRLGGNLLFLVGTALVPVTIFAIASAFGSSDSDKFFSEKDLPAATALLALSVVLTAALVVLTRVPQASLVPAGFVVILAGTAAAWAFGSDESDELWSAVTAAGGLLVGLSIALTAYKAREHGFWVGVGGHIGLYVGATVLLAGLHWSPASATDRGGGWRVHDCHSRNRAGGDRRESAPGVCGDWAVSDRRRYAVSACAAPVGDEPSVAAGKNRRRRRGLPATSPIPWEPHPRAGKSNEAQSLH